MTTNKTRGRSTRPKYRYSRDWEKSVQSVLESYIQVCAQEPVGAVQLGPYGDSTPRLNAYKAVQFKIDVELGIADSLRNHVHLVPVLQNMVKEIADLPFEPVSAGDQVAVTQRLGPVFARRGLAPYKYFSERRKCKRKR